VCNRYGFRILVDRYLLRTMLSTASFDRLDMVRGSEPKRSAEVSERDYQVGKAASTPTMSPTGERDAYPVRRQLIRPLATTSDS
jgi:hypothetical protein